MSAEVSPAQYKDVVLFLATAGVVVPLFRRWKISPILGFLVAGVALGPFGLGALAREFPWLSFVTIDKPDEVAQLAEFGVVFLLFTIGLELSWERLRLMRRLVFGFGALQVLLCGGAAVGLALLLRQDRHDHGGGGQGERRANRSGGGRRLSHGQRHASDGGDA